MRRSRTIHAGVTKIFGPSQLNLVDQKGELVGGPHVVVSQLRKAIHSPLACRRPVSGKPACSESPLVLGRARPSGPRSPPRPPVARRRAPSSTTITSASMPRCMSAARSPSRGSCSQRFCVGMMIDTRGSSSPDSMVLWVRDHAIPLLGLNPPLARNPL